MEPSVTARQEFEIQNGYYACGINGCILAERHTGVCVMPELPNQTRVCRVRCRLYYSVLGLYA